MKNTSNPTYKGVFNGVSVSQNYQNFSKPLPKKRIRHVRIAIQKKTSYPQQLCFRHGVMMIMSIKRVSLSRRLICHSTTLLTQRNKVTPKSNKLEQIFKVAWIDWTLNLSIHEKVLKVRRDTWLSILKSFIFWPNPNFFEPQYTKTLVTV